MILTKELAACSIYGFEITTENKEKSMSLLQKAGLVPVYLANGVPTLAVVTGGINKIKTGPWKYQEFKSEENRKNKENECDEGKYIKYIELIFSFFFLREYRKKIITLFLDKKYEDSYDSYEIKGKSKSHSKRSSNSVWL